MVDPLRVSCPVCGKPAAAGTAPFCSKRCADVDLGRWLSGVYRVPGTEEGGEGDQPGDEPQ
ncbi:MAG: DNA gyrase inhibitor YacG [Acetobacteraceae bacterium]